MADDSTEDLLEKAKEGITSSCSSAWIFPGCSCLLMLLFIILGVAAFAATFAKHQGEESGLEGGLTGATCGPSTQDGHSLAEIQLADQTSKISWFGRPDSPSFCRDTGNNGIDGFDGSQIPSGCDINNPSDYYAAVCTPNSSGTDCVTNSWWHNKQLLVIKGDKSVLVTIRDKGPAPWTGRKIDVSYAAFKALGVKTDDTVQVCFPGAGGSIGNGDIASIALSQVGKCYNDDNTPYNNYNGEQWCAYFAEWVYKQAGYNVPSEGSSRSLLNWFRSSGHTVFTNPSQAAPGNIVVWKHSNDNAGHTGIVVANNGSTITTVEGNSSRDCVAEHTYSYYSIVTQFAGLAGFGRW